MVGETPSKVRDTAFSITSDVGHFSNVVEHLAACEEKDDDQTDGSPKIPVLDDGRNIWMGDTDEGGDTEGDSSAGDKSKIVDRSGNGRFETLRKVARDPAVDLVR